MEREIPRSEEYQSPDGAKVLQGKKVRSYVRVIEKGYQSPDGAKVLQGCFGIAVGFKSDVYQSPDGAKVLQV